VVPDLVAEACGRLGISPVPDAGRGESIGKAGHTRGFLRARKTPPKKVSAGDIACHREGGFPPVLWRLRGQPRPSAQGLGRGGLRCGPGLGGGGMLPPGHFPRQGCLCDAGEPPLPGVLDEGGRHAQTPTAGPPIEEGSPRPGPGRPVHDAPPPHGHPSPRESARKGGPQAGRATISQHGASRGCPCQPVVSQTPPFLSRPPVSARRTLFQPREAEVSSPDALARAGPLPEDPTPRDTPLAPMTTDPEPVHMDMQGDTWDAPPPATGPMEMDKSSKEGPARLPSQPSLHPPHPPYGSAQYRGARAARGPHR